MMLLMRLAIKHLLRNQGFSLFFILNLSIGLAGFIALNSFNYSIQKHLRNNLKEILTADLAVSSSRPLNQIEIKTIETTLGNDKQESRQISFFSMVSGNNLSRLARLIAVDNKFPLYGSILMKKKQSGDAKNSKNSSHNPGIRAAGPLKNNLESGPDSSVQEKNNISYNINGTLPVTWISQDLAISLNIKPGDTLRIGTMDFVVDDIVISSPGSAVTPVEFAPNVYIGISHLNRTGLMGFGSRVKYTRYYRFMTLKDKAIKAKNMALREAINPLFEGEPLIRVYDSEDVNQNLGRVFGYFTGYMGLVAIVALFLAGIGTAYLFRGYLNARLKEIAILMSLGAGRMDAWFLLLCQLLTLGLIATILSVMLSFGLLPLFPEILKDLIPHNFQTTANPESLIMASFLGTIGSVIFCLPVFVRIQALKPLVLLQGLDKLNHIKPPILLQILSFFPAVIAFWILAVSQAVSFQRGTLFFMGFIGVMLIMSLIARAILSLIRRLSNTNHVIQKIAFRNLYRNKLSFISCFVTIAMGAFLINIIPQIKSGIQDEISRPQGLKIPGFFLIDIQPEQLNPLEVFLKERGEPLTNASPMVRGRINQVNGVGFYDRFDEKKNGIMTKGLRNINQNEKIKDSRQRHFRRREFNFSWREKLDISETIVKGKPLSKIPWDFAAGRGMSGFMEISLEEGFADRFNLKIGDVMRFDIHGIPLEGRIVNLRKVRWNSFQPNFFILFQKGVLDDAPKTYLASIPQMPSDRKMPLQNALAREFPNISVLDVNQAVKQLLKITDRLSFSINFMAWLAILAGLVVLFSIVRQETRGRSWEINLLKVLGAGFSDVRSIILFEFGFLGFSASFFAILLSLGCSYAISWLFFGRLWSFPWSYTLFCFGSITLICIGTALLAAGRVIRQKPAAMLL